MCFVFVRWLVLVKKWYYLYLLFYVFCICQVTGVGEEMILSIPIILCVLYLSGDRCRWRNDTIYTYYFMCFVFVRWPVSVKKWYYLYLDEVSD